MIDTVVIIFLVLGAVGLYPLVGIIRDHYSNGPLHDDEGDQAGHTRFVYRCIAFVVFYLTILLMTALPPTRPYVMLMFYLGLAAFLVSYFVGQIRRNQVSPIFFEKFVGTTNRPGRYALALGLNFAFAGAALFLVVDEFLRLLGRT